jgi:crotonobetainyl-CoA:carnitine CoA-transferase CaiB-like acyl-CoA transferase
VIEAPDLAGDPRFATNRGRVANYEALRPALAERLRRRNRAAWVEALKREAVPCGSVRDIGEVLQDEQLEARGMIERLDHLTAGMIRVLGVPIKLSDTSGSVRTPPPLLGQHTVSILSRDLGLTGEEIEALRSSGAI